MVDAHVVEGLVHDLGLEVALGVGGTGLGQVLADVGLVLVEGVELGDVLGELVVELGQLGLADGVDLHLEGGVLAGKILSVLLREGHVDLAVLRRPPCRRADPRSRG